MYVKYGTYFHAAGEVTLKGIMRDSLRSEDGLVYAITEIWDLEGRLQIDDQGTAAANQAAMTTAINALKTAYSTNGKDLGFYDNADNVTSHFLDSSTSTMGVQITQQPSFPVGGGAEYSTFRTYSLRAEAQWGYSGGGGQMLVSWTETVSFRGTGGRTWGYLVPIVGSPQQQLLTETSTHWAFQRGEATGNGYYPIVPGPKWPSQEHEEQREIQYAVPRASSGKRSVSWSYVFEAATSISGYPTAKSIN